MVGVIRLKMDQSQNLAHINECEREESSGQSGCSMWCGRSGLGSVGFMAVGCSYRFPGLTRLKW